MTGTIVHVWASACFILLLIVIGMLASLGNALADINARISEVAARTPRKIVRDESRKRDTKPTAKP